MLLVYMIVVTLAVWQTVEILHHSTAGTLWRAAGKFLLLLPRPFSWLGYGMTCPFCYSNWVGIVYSLIVVRPTSLFDLFLAVIAGIGAARLANFLNDYFKSCCNTPNSNEDSASFKAAKANQQEVKTVNTPEITL